MKDSTLTVGLGSSGSSFTVCVQLESGIASGTWSGSPTTSWVPVRRSVRRELTIGRIDDTLLTTLREFAERMLAHGDYEYRDQFAQATVGFNARNGDQVVRWEYHVDGDPAGYADDIYEHIADLVWKDLRKQAAAEAASPALMPDVQDDDALMPIHGIADPWMPATLAIADRHGLSTEGWTRATAGSHIVMLNEDVALKFVVPFWNDDVDIEEAAIDLVQYKLPIDVPRVVARGTLDGWEYMATRRVQGTALRDVPDLSDDELTGIATALGETLRVLHDLKVPKESSLWGVVPKWRAFLSDQRARRAEIEEARGTDPEWTARLVKHLRSWRYRARKTKTLLHADLTYDHIMLSQVDGSWQLSGLIDFGDAKVGDPAYDFAAVFCFFTEGRPDLRATMLEAYGGVDEAFVDRIFESLLLHEFGRLAALNLEGLETIEDIYERYIAV